jgi:hypothetical protein
MTNMMTSNDTTFMPNFVKTSQLIKNIHTYTLSLSKMSAHIILFHPPKKDRNKENRKTKEGGIQVHILKRKTGILPLEICPRIR